MADALLSSGGASQPDWNSYIQRGATLQTYRAMGDVDHIAPSGFLHSTDTLVAYPFVMGAPATLDRIGFNVTTAGGAGTLTRAGIYRATSLQNIYPAGLVIESGAIATDVIGFKETVVNQALDAGLYWAAFLSGVGAPTLSAPGAAAGYPPVLGFTGANPPVRWLTIRGALAFAALPATFPGGIGLNTNSHPLLYGRFSA